MAVVGVSAPRAEAGSARVRQARQLFQQAQAAYQRGAYNQALAKFEAALDLAKRPSILLNIAQCHRQLGNAEKALSFYRQYLAEWERFRPGIEAPYRTEVDGHIAQLTEELSQRDEAAALAAGAGSGAAPTGSEPSPPTPDPARVYLEEVPAGAELIVDGERVQLARGGTISLRLDPGEHVVLVSLPGHKPWHREVVLEVGDNARYRVRLTEVEPTGSTAWLVTGICTATLAVGAEVFAIASTVLANDEFKGSSDFERYKTMAISGHVLAGAFLITSGISWWLYYRSTRPEAGDTRAAFAVSPTSDGFSAAMRFRF